MQTLCTHVKVCTWREWIARVSYIKICVSRCGHVTIYIWCILMRKQSVLGEINVENRIKSNKIKSLDLKRGSQVIKKIVNEMKEHQKQTLNLGLSDQIKIALWSDGHSRWSVNVHMNANKARYKWSDTPSAAHNRSITTK